MKNTKIICGFPVIGKTYSFKHNFIYLILDAEYTSFFYRDCFDRRNRDKEFPDNYIKYIKSNMGKVDYIFVAIYPNVRQALKENNLEYTMVYPDRNIDRMKYVGRYMSKGNVNNNRHKQNVLLNTWNSLFDSIEKDDSESIVLKENEFLDDLIIRKNAKDTHISKYIKEY